MEQEDLDVIMNLLRVWNYAAEKRDTGTQLPKARYDSWKNTEGFFFSPSSI